MLTSVTFPPGCDISMKVQLVSTHSLFLCAHKMLSAISLDVRDLALRFAKKHAMSLPGGREMEYSAKVLQDATNTTLRSRNFVKERGVCIALKPKKWSYLIIFFCYTWISTNKISFFLSPKSVQRL